MSIIALPQWRRKPSRDWSLENSAGDRNENRGSRNMIPTRFVFEKIESSTHASSGYDVRESEHNSPSTVIYRSTFHIFVEDVDHAGQRDSRIPVGTVGTKGRKMENDVNRQRSQKPRRSLRSRLRGGLDYLKGALLHKNHALPEEATLSQKLRHACLCPPHGPLALFLSKLLIGLLIWLTLLSILKEDALPGGNVFALLVLVGAAFVGGFLVSLIRLPPLLGMLIVGFILRNVPGINVAGDINPKWSANLRNIALTVILIRAGLGLDGSALKKLSKSVLLLSFLPCLTEALSVGVTAHFILGFPWLWGFLLGFVQAAVSPAVLVPFMLNLQETRLGTKQGIPTLLIAASSLDDVVAISGFSVLLSIIFSRQDAVLWFQVVQGPLELLMGLAYGILVGFIFWYLPHRHHAHLSTLRFLFLLLGGLVAVFGSRALDYSGAGALGSLTAAFVAGHKWRCHGWNIERVKAAEVFGYLWVFCQPVLFGLIGAEVVLANVHLETVGLAFVVMLITVAVRVVFTVVAVSCAGLNFKERLFVAIAWLPKATVQAALGSLALDAARDAAASPDIILLGEKVVTIAVLLIIVTAPLGAVGISLSAPRLLQRDMTSPNDVAPTANVQEDAKNSFDLKKTEYNPGEVTKMIDASDA